MASITGALAKVKDNPRQLLDPQVIMQACRQAGHRWRDRVLNPVVTLRLFILQVLHGHSSCQGVTRLSDLSFSAQAYCEARRRLPLRVYQYVCRAFVQGLLQLAEEAADAACWHGHRLLRVDGTGVSMPDTPALGKHFGRPANTKPGCGFPVAHLLVLMHAGTGMIIDIIASCWNTHDASQLRALLGHLRAGDVLVGDRAFSSYVHLALLFQQGAHGVLRLHQRIITSFKQQRPCRRQLPKHERQGAPASRFVRRLGPEDQLVIYYKPRRRPDWMSQEDYDALPEELLVRELRYRITRRGYRTRVVTLVTTLLDPQQYPWQELAGLYEQRWQIETDLRALKQSLKMDVLRCQSVDAVLKEMLVFVMVYNQVRLVMFEAARRQGVAPERISFMDAVRWLCSSPPEGAVAVLLVNPHRPGRHQPRVIKRRKDRYPKMKRPRAEYLQAMQLQVVAA